MYVPPISAFLLLVTISNSVASLRPLTPHNNSLAKLRESDGRLLAALCPPWRYQRPSTSSCVCGYSVHNVVRCEDNETSVDLLTCHCMSYSDSDESIVVGNCPYLCTDDFYTDINDYSDIADLCNREIEQNRHGQMCGKCLDNFSPSPYSYSLECSNCSGSTTNNWAKYFLIAYVPLTFFFFTMIVVRFNAMSPSVNPLMLYGQMLGCSAIMSIFSIFIQFTQRQPADPDLNVMLVAKVVISFYGIWNLDFFRMFYSPFCLHPNMSILQVLSLDYAIAVYPLCLVFVVFVAIKIHDRLKVVQQLWKPAGWLFTRINRQWKTSNSLIEAFGTFFLFSYVKIGDTSFNILLPVQLYNVSGRIDTLYVYYNGSMEYFGHEHCPYAILAIFMFTTFNLLPLLLLFLYPCRCFQSCLNCCRLNSQVLRTFMDAFQGCYKFEPYDCRYWSAFYLFIRMAILSIFAFTQSGYGLLVCGIFLIPVTALFAIVRPYRQNCYNVIDTVMLLSLILLCFAGVGFSLSSFDRRYESLVTIMAGGSLVLPIVYITVLLIKYVIPGRLVAVVKTYVKCVWCRQIDEDSLQNRGLIESEKHCLLNSGNQGEPYDDSDSAY